MVNPYRFLNERGEHLHTLGGEPLYGVSSVMSVIAKPLTDRFLKFVSPEPYSGCWLWTGSIKSSFGYGQFWLSGNVFAHRAAWLIFKGAIPESVQVLHKCDTPTCVNPGHLYLGTQSRNVKDAYDRKRRLPNRKLTPEDVEEIRQSGKPQSWLARKFGVAQPTISKIQLRQRW